MRSIRHWLKTFTIVFFVFGSGVTLHAADMQPTIFDDSVDPVPANGLVDYYVQLSNNSPGHADFVSLAIDLPAEFAYDSNPNNPECSHSGEPLGGTVTCIYPVFPGLATQDINVTLRAASTTGVYSGSATVSFIGPGPDENPGNDNEVIQTTVTESADLNLTKTAIPTTIPAGGIVTFRFDVNNTGPYPASGLSLSDALPAGLSWYADNNSTPADDDAAWNCSNAGADVTCLGPTLAVGASSTFYFRARVTSASTGDITNSATVSSSIPDADPDNNTDTDVITVLAGTDMRINKRVVTSPVIANNPVRFELDVHNDGPMVAENVSVVDILPSGYTDINVTAVGWTCSVVDLNVTCSRDASMLSGTMETIEIDATVPDTPDTVTHQNGATVSTTTADAVSSNNSDIENYSVYPDQADLHLSKTKSPTPIAVGGRATSVIDVRNNGPRVADPVQVVDVLSPLETYDGFSGAGWSCTDNAGVVTCDYASPLSMEQNASVLTIYTIAVAAGDMNNTACTGGSGGSTEPGNEDKTGSNDCSSASVLATDIPNVCDLDVNKTTSDSYIDENESTFTYNIAVRNAGPNPALAVDFRDDIPQYVSAYQSRPATLITAIPDNGSSCNVSNALVTCQLGDINVSETVNVAITVQRPFEDGNLTNTASAYSTLTGDVNRSNNVDSVDVSVEPVAEIEMVRKQVAYLGYPDPIFAGTEATYTLQIRNNGPSVAQNVSVADAFSGEAFTFISASAESGTCSYDGGTRILGCDMGDINPNVTRSITVVVRPDHQIPAPAVWEINNTATVTMDTIDSNLSNNRKDLGILVKDGEVDLGIEKKESPDFHEPVQYDPTKPGMNYLVYQVDIRNDGPSLATGVVFSDRVTSVFPDVGQQLTFVRDTANPDGTASGSTICTPPASNPFTVNASAPSIDCSVGDLASGATYTRYLVFNVEDAPHLVSGDVYYDEINVTSRENESLLANNIESERTTVRTVVDVVIDKTVSKPVVEVEEHFTFILDVINTGPGWAPNTLVTDNLPADMVLTGTPISTEGNCTGVAGDTGFVCNINDSNGTLKDGIPVLITVPVKMTAWPASGSVTNTASVSTDGPDYNSTNDTNSSTVGVHQPAQIGNYVWEDMDADGRQDDGASRGIAGVPVYLVLDSNNSVVQSTVTNGSGYYGFTINHADDYRVQFVPPAGYLISPQDAASGNDALDSDINLTASTDVFTVNYGDDNQTIDAGLFRYASLGDRVWIDENGNGRQDSGEPNVSDVNVTLYREGNTTAQASMLTNASGNYLFDNLIPGRYYVEFNKTTLPSAEYVFTTYDVGSEGGDSDVNDRQTGRSDTTTLTSNENERRMDAGIYIPVSIGDFVWHDANGNGIQDAGEMPLSDVNVTLMNAGCSTAINSDQNSSAAFVNPQLSDATGAYLFENLTPGTYCVRFAAPAGTVYVVTTQDQGSDNNDSDADSIGSSSGDTGNYQLTSGEDNRSVDAGFYLAVSIGDRVWEDENYNGIQDAGEDNVSGVRVTLVKDGVLQDGTGGTTNTFRDTNASGEYLFDDLIPGHAYSVSFSNLPADYRFTLQDVGVDDAADSDVNATTGRASGATPTTVSDDENLTFDAGIYKPVIIGDHVWEDMNANGIQEPGEPGIAGVVVTLVIDGVVQDGTGGTTLTTATTDGTGEYLFDTSYDLKPNHSYSVEFTLPATYIVTTQNATTDDLDSDANALGVGVAATPTMYSGEQNLTLDAGLYRNAALGNRVWLDSNGNGVQDGSEVGVDGVTVTLYNGIGVQQGVPIVTSNGGLYHFEDLRPGAYYVTFTNLPPNYVFTGQNEGAEGVDSDVNTTSGRSDTVILTSNEDNNDTDAGIYIPASIGNFAWLDTNADGNQDGGEPGLSDINVTLYKVEDNGTHTEIGTDTTDSNGIYGFDNLRPGNYYLQGSAPSNYDVSPLNSGDTNASDSDFDPVTARTVVTALESGENDMTWDGGLYEVASIGDRVWIDRDADGIQDAGELNVTDAGITIVLLDESNGTVATQNGVVDGIYGFTDLVPGEYHIRVTLPAEYSVSPQDVNSTTDDMDSDLNTTAVAPNQYETVPTVLVSGENDPSWDIGIYESASIGNLAWLDLDADGIQDAGEPGLADINVSLFKVEDNGSNTFMGMDTTDANGTYGFDDLVPGEYYLVGSAPDGYYVSPINANGDSDDAVDSDFNATTGATIVTTLESGENDTSWDGGLYELASIGDVVWIDTNGDGVQNDIETLDVNVTVVLYDINGEVNRTTVVSGSDGSYLFDELVPAEYHVEFIPEAASGYLFIAPDQGGDDAADSDVNQSTGQTPTEQLTSGENNLTLDAGIYRPASLGDRVWLDENADGIQDVGEANLTDVTVTLLDQSGNPVGTTVTDENGTYIFSGLVPGTYSVEFNLTDENGSDLYVPTLKDVPFDESSDSDVNATGFTEPVDLVSGEYNPDIDAGLYIPVSVGDYVWSDYDRDGVQDVGELPIAGVRVTLFQEGNPTALSFTDTNSSGGYLFDGLAPGNYYVVFTRPAHYMPTVQDSSSGTDSNDSDADALGQTAVFTLVSPEDNLTIDAGFYELATISGTVMEDTDNDDLGEVFLQGVEIRLLDSNGTLVDTQFTDVNGSYRFIDVEPGNYTVVETQPDAMVSVSEDEGGADNDAGDTALNDRISVIVGVGEDDVNNDFVEEMGVNIGNRVWMDVNGDGIQDGSENNTTVLENISVNLYRDGAYVATETTDEFGYYLFENYPDGNYSVEFNLTTLPVHYGVTKQDQGSDDTNDSDVNATTFDTINDTAAMTVEDTLIPGEHNLTFDMGIYRLGTISGTVRVDIDGDFEVDGPHDDVLSGVTIELLDEHGNVVATTVTDANGYYEFIDVPQGNYTVREVQPVGYLDINSTDGDGINDDNNTIIVIMDPGEDDTENDFNDRLGGRIGNYVWHDNGIDGLIHEANGLQDPDENGTNGVHVCLEDTLGDPIIDVTSGQQRCTDTNATGYYEFVGLIPQDYVVVFEIPRGTALTPYPQEGDDIDNDSNPIEMELDANGTLIAKAPITVEPGDQNDTIDMGLVYIGTAKIGDRVWHDADRNGILDNGEEGVDGVEVRLYDENGTLLETYITHSGGYYIFEHLYAGDYTVEFILPRDWTFTDRDIEDDGDGADSDANTDTGRTVEISLKEGEHQRIWDAGLYCMCEDAVNSSDSGDSLGTWSMILMLLMTGITGLYYVRKEENLIQEER